MTGLTALLLTPEKRLAAVTLGGITTRELCVLSIVVEGATVVMHVNSLMEYSNAGCTLQDTGQRPARMERTARERCVSLHTHLAS